MILEGLQRSIFFQVHGRLQGLHGQMTRLDALLTFGNIGLPSDSNKVITVPPSLRISMLLNLNAWIRPQKTGTIRFVEEQTTAMNPQDAELLSKSELDRQVIKNNLLKAKNIPTSRTEGRIHGIVISNNHEVLIIDTRNALGRVKGDRKRIVFA